MTDGAWIILKLRDLRPDEDREARLRGLLKRALRCYGFRAVVLDVVERAHGDKPWPPGDNEPSVNP